MFDNKRYVTKGIIDTIPEYLQNILWYLIETLEVRQIDRFQVFELCGVYKDSKYKQKITHSQEHPPYRKEDIITVNTPVTAKVFVIDDGDHSTMLMAEEYQDER